MADDPVTPKDGRRPSRRSVVIIAAAVVVVIVAVILIAVGVFSGRSTTPTAVESTFATVAPRPTVDVTAPTTVKATAPAVAPLPSGTATPGTKAEPVPLTSPATPVRDVRVTVGTVEAVQGKADGIGEVDAPAIRFEMTVDNRRSSALSLASAVVTVTYGDDATPADEYTSVRKGLPQSVGAGQTATGTFAFAVPEKERGDVSISFDYQVGTPIAVFSGSVSR